MCVLFLEDFLSAHTLHSWCWLDGTLTKYTLPFCLQQSFASGMFIFTIRTWRLQVGVSIQSLTDRTWDGNAMVALIRSACLFLTLLTILLCQSTSASTHLHHSIGKANDLTEGQPCLLPYDTVHDDVQRVGIRTTSLTWKNHISNGIAKTCHDKSAWPYSTMIL